MLRRRDFIRIAGLSGLGLYVESALPAFGKLIADHPGDIENLNSALNIAESIEDSAYRARATCRVAGGFYNKGKKEFSDALAIKALKMSFQAGKGKNLALKAVGEYFLKANNFKKTLRIINIMDNQGIMKYFLLLKTSYFLHKKGNIGLSDRLLTMIDPPCSSIYLDPSALENSPENSFLEWLERINRICRKTDYTKYLASSWFRIGDSVKGHRYLEEVWNFSPVDAIKIGVSYLPEEDIRTLEKRIFLLDDKQQKIESLFNLAEYYIQKAPEKAGEIITLCREIIGSDGSPEQYAILGRLLVRNGSIEEGKWYLSSVPEMIIDRFSEEETEERIYALSHYLEELIVEYIRAGLQDEIPDLLATLDSKDIQYDEPLWYPGITKMAEEANCRNNAITFLEKEIKRVARKKLPDRINCFAELASTFLHQNEREKGIKLALSVINDLETLLSNRNLKSRIDFAYLSPIPYIKHSDIIFLDAVPRVSLELARYSMSNEARTIAEMVEDKDLYDDICYYTAGYLSETGRFKEALKVAKEIRDIKSRGKGIYKVVSEIVDLNIKSV